MIKFKEWFDNKKNVNEFIFTWYMFSYLIYLPISIMINVNVYRVFYYANLSILLFISFYKNKSIFQKKDFILFFIALFIYVIDICFRKNSYTNSIIYNFFKLTYIPCYFFNRVTNIKVLISYLAFGAKIALIVYLFDPLFKYHFLITYMQYGVNVALPAFGLVYINHFVQRKDTDLIFLILSFFAVLVYSNRTCLLCVLCLLILTYKFILRDIYKFKKNYRVNIKEKVKKNIIVMILVVFSFGINLGLNSITIIKTNLKNDVISTQNNEEDQISFIFDNYSYSLKKYEQMMNGEYNTILSGRQEIYMKAIDTIKATFVNSKFKLFFGNGTGYFREINNGVYTHCIIFDLVIEYGIFGLLVFTSIFVICFVKWIKTCKSFKYLMGAYFLSLSLPKLLLSTYIQIETYIWLFFVYIIMLFPFFGNKRENK